MINVNVICRLISILRIRQSCNQSTMHMIMMIYNINLTIVKKYILLDDGQGYDAMMEIGQHLLDKFHHFYCEHFSLR